MLAKLIARVGGKITKRGQSVSDNLDGISFALLILAIFGVVGSIETGRWFG